METNGARQAGRRGGKAYLAASFAAQFCALARYTLLARLLGPEQLGLAVALILTAQFFESVTDSGSDRFLVQDKQGDDPEVQKLVHLVWVVRGVLIAAALVLLARPLAAFYDTPALAGGFLILAFSPLIAGLVNLDFRRTQRHSDFRGESRALLASEIASLLVTAAAAYLLRDFTAILYGLITRSLILMLVSHMTAERRYTLGYAAQHSRRLGKFALPLMANGLVLFLGSQGDRVFIGRELGVVELGRFSAAVLLIYYPAAMVQRYVSAMHLPLVAASFRDSERQTEAVERLGGQTLLLAVAMSAGFTVVAAPVIVLLYGPEFAQATTVIAAIAVLHSSRFIRLWPVTIALAQGRSGTVLLSNLMRLAGFPLAAAGLKFIGGLTGILAGFLAAEIIAFMFAVIIVYRHPNLSMKAGVSRAALFIAWSGIILGGAVTLRYENLSGAFFLIPVLMLTLVLTYRREARTASEGWALAKRLVGRFS